MRLLKRILAGLVTVVGLLLVVVAAGALLPENIRWQEADEGVTIWVDGTAAHTELILPVAAAGHDWRTRIDHRHFPDGGHPHAYLSFSWGERSFFLTTPSWSDFRLSAGLNALLRGHSTLIHVYRIDWQPSGGALRLSEEQYRRLVAHLEAQFAEQEEVLAGYGPNDAFFAARGRYSPWRTCNQWTRDALAVAGIRVGRWTPFSQSLMWRFQGEREDAP
jgi:uncharacterized protein (TIGR02117 family)